MNRYEAILVSIRDSFEQQAGCLLDDASDSAVKFRVIASEIARLYERLDYYEQQIFPNTAEGEYLERHGAVRGITKKRAARAGGPLIFNCKTVPTEDIFVPAGTLCTSSRGSGLMYQTTQDLTIPAGSAYGVAQIESVEAGVHTNIAPGYVDILVTPIAGISSIENTVKISGGADEEPDEMFRERVIEAFSSISNGANTSYYEQFARSRDDIWYAKAVASSSAVNQLDLYVENYTRTLSDGIVTELQAEIEAVRQLGVKVAVKRPAIKTVNLSVTIRVDNLANESVHRYAVDQALADAVSSLGIGQRFSPAAAIGRVLALPGIADAVLTSPTAPISVGAGEICQPGSISITVEAM